MGRYSGGETADPGLHEDMGRHLRHLLGGLGDGDHVAFHHQGRDLRLLILAGVGDDRPAFPARGRSALGDGLVIGAARPDHFGTEGGDGGSSPVTDRGRHEDDRPAAGARRTPGDGAAVIAVRRAGKNAIRARPLARHEPGDGIGTAQRLEGFQLEALPLVLEPEPSEAEPRREIL